MAILFFYLGNNIGVYPSLTIVPLMVGGRAKRRGYCCDILYHLPLFEGTPPTLGGESNGG